MHDCELEDLALDFKELLFLLSEARTRKELLPVTERHINRLIKTMEEIRDHIGFSKTVEAPEEKKEQEQIPPATMLGEQFKPAAELSKGLTLNDTFRFARELFNGDKDEANRVLKELSRMDSLADAVSYLSSQTEWDEENDAVKDLIELLKKYFTA
ncbi:MAG: hypothetical protein LBU44_03140 [Mediterranea sp.]|jgi:hypothetical protein|nr:hypothetical protein [Mediterranea sp.]